MVPHTTSSSADPNSPQHSQRQQQHAHDGTEAQESSMTPSTSHPAGADVEGGSEAPLSGTASSQAPTSGRRSTTTRLTRTNTQNAQKDKDRDKDNPKGQIPSSVSLDPLSNQIYMRTNSNTESPTIAQRLRAPVSGRPESPNPEASTGTTVDGNKQPNAVVDATKDWRKGQSIFSRLTMRPPWSRDDDAPDSDSEMGDARDDGANARALTSATGGGYIPFHKEPPRYIRVKTRNKKTKEFNRMFLAQELSVSNPEEAQGLGRRAPATAVGSKIMKGASAAIWTAEFSKDGRHLAVGGKDHMLRVFSVIATPEDRRAQEEDEAQCAGNGEKLSAPVFRSRPKREYQGHTGEVLSLSWSKNGFLLSSSMDKTVKLWHPDRAECLATFRHADIVTSIAFHPTDDRFFLSGCLDSQLRLWSIPDNNTPYTAETHEFITAVGFSPDGNTAICGVLSGMCTFYDTKGLESQFQIHVRSSRGKNAKGSKITGIQTAAVNEGPEKGDVKVLISSNDSRVRVYSLKTRMLESKYRGHVNQSSQIHARFSEDAKHIICGSEDRKAYIWGPTSADAETRDKQPYECFDAHPEVVTVAAVAPTKSRQLLSASGDPIYDLCNPPPITLVSVGESQASGSDAGQSQRTREGSDAKKPEQSPAYIERSKHNDGNIFVTTDRTGTIKVFRQDCAFAKRQQNMWETGSKFSGRVASGVGRSASIRTKASGASRAQSRRGSLTLNQSPVLSQPASDRIISWRQDIDRGLRPSRNVTPTGSVRSVSPNKASRASIASGTNLASDSRKEPYVTSPVLQSTPASPTSSTRTTNRLSRQMKDKGSETTSNIPPTPSFSFLSADSRKSESGEGGFWGRWKGGLSSKYSSGSLAPVGSGDSPGRRSIGAPEAGRLNVSNDPKSRRVSSGAKLSSQVQEEQEPNQTLQEGGKDLPLRQPSPKPRVDSGVGRFSVESGEETPKS